MGQQAQAHRVATYNKRKGVGVVSGGDGNDGTLGNGKRGSWSEAGGNCIVDRGSGATKDGGRTAQTRGGYS